MEDSPLLLLFFMIYLIAGIFNRKKNTKKPRGRARTSPMRTRAQGERMDVQAAARDSQTMEGFRSAFGDHEQDVQCKDQRMHLHAVSQEQMHRAMEGEDPCHVGGILPEEASENAMPVDDEALQLRQDILRGVIMSEILTRPCERMAIRGGGHRRHGY